MRRRSARQRRHVLRERHHLCSLHALAPAPCARGAHERGACRAQVACAEVFAPLYDECGDALNAVGGDLDMFYTSCLEALYKPGRCGDGCTAATLNCRLAELNQACCSQPGACAANSLVPAECSVEWSAACSAALPARW